MTNKKLSLSSIKKSTNKLNEKFTVQVQDRFSESYEIIVNKYFKKTDIAKLLGDFISISQQLKENNENQEVESNSFLDSTYLFTILIIKYMTNIPIPDGLECILYVSELINLEILEQIIKFIPKEEIEKVNEWVKETTNNMPEIVEGMLKNTFLTENLGVEERAVD